jgi:hypothetical protein
MLGEAIKFKSRWCSSDEVDTVAHRFLKSKGGGMNQNALGELVIIDKWNGVIRVCSKRN